MSCRERHLGNRMLREAVGRMADQFDRHLRIGIADHRFQRLHQFIRRHGRCSTPNLQRQSFARSSRSITHAFNTNCYTEPAASTESLLPQSGHHKLRGDSRQRRPAMSWFSPESTTGIWDCKNPSSVFGEGRELQFRADSFNTFNHTQWSAMNNSYCPFLGYAPCVIDDRQTNAESHFGYVSASHPGRHVQLNAKFVF